MLYFVDDLPAYIQAHQLIPKQYVSTPSFVGILKVSIYIEKFNLPEINLGTRAKIYMYRMIFKLQ